MGVSVLQRVGRKVILTAAGEQLLAYAKRMVDINNEVFSRMPEQAFEGKMTLGVPSDIVGPIIPPVLRRFHAEFSAVKIELISYFTRTLKEQFFNSEIDIDITTEPDVSSGGEILKTTALRRFGAPNGKAWQERPLPYSAFKFCSLNLTTLACLDQANISWKLVSNSKSERVTEATVAADLAVTTAL